ncbi:ABC transporter permease [Agromyces bauzanensis]
MNDRRRFPPAFALAGRRALLTIPLIGIVSALTFLLVSLAPGDIAAEILGATATPEQYDELRSRLGLDLPITTQYLNWVSMAVRGDLGTSLFNAQSVSGAITDRTPVTIALAGFSLLISFVVGVALGMTSAVRGGALAKLIDALAMTAWAVPSFWASAMLILLFAVRLGWLPAVGYVPPTTSLGDWAASLVLPVVSLSLGGIAAITKHTRETMLEILGSEYVRVARANGVPRGSLYFRHALRNAAVPVITVTGLVAVGLVGGTVIVESLFALPGLGSLIVTSSIQQDLPMIQGVVIVLTAAVIAINLITDLLYTAVNPKVHVR